MSVKDFSIKSSWNLKVSRFEFGSRKPVNCRAEYRIMFARAKIRHVSVALDSELLSDHSACLNPNQTVTNGNKCHVSTIKCVKMLIRPEHTAKATTTATTSGETAKAKRKKENKRTGNRSTTRTGRFSPSFSLFHCAAYANFKPEKCIVLLVILS